MRSTGTGWSRSTTWGLGALAAVTIMGAASAGPWAGLGFAAVFTMITGIYHLIRGRSWVSAFIPRGRASGAALLFGGLVVLFVAAAASPETDPQSAIPTNPSPSVVTQTSAATTPTPSPSPSPTPTPSLAPPVPSPALTSVAPSTPEATDPRLALSVLETLEIKGRAPKTGYDRALFGQRWADVDRNGCDTRIICIAQGSGGLLVA